MINGIVCLAFGFIYRGCLEIRGWKKWAKRVLGERVVCLCGCLFPCDPRSGEEIGQFCRGRQACLDLDLDLELDLDFDLDMS